MAQYLLELLTEEIPARMQAGARDFIKNSVESKLKDAGIAFSSLETFVAPRRLGFCLEGLPTKQEDRVEEKRGPRVGAPEKAMEGFLSSANITVEECEQREVEGKGLFYFVQKHVPGRSIQDILTQMVSEIIQEFQWSKSMRWGSYAMTWVRPLRSIISLLDGEILPIDVEDPHVTVGKTTHGHRFLSPSVLTVESYEDYKKQLLENYVMVDPEARKQIIETQLKEVCEKNNLVFKDDARLLQEVTGLVEWPVVILGRIDARFMDLPPEVLETTMKTHQKYFPTFHQDGTAAPYFLAVSNMETIDQGQQIIEGNERVLRARLSDAEFFWTQDQKKSLESWRDGLNTLIFHEKIGSVFEKTERMEALAEVVVSDASLKKEAKRAAALSKADLVTGMVGEFPELQGIMGGYYSTKEEGDVVASALREHYAPQGPSDDVPQAPVSVAVSLADKIDTLVSFWSVGIQPTGSKDPYALRRGALGVIRLIFDNKMDVSLGALFDVAYDLLPKGIEKSEKTDTSNSLLNFMAGRLKGFFRDLGFDSTHVNAAITEDWDGDVCGAYQVLNVLSDFLSKPEGQDLVVAYKRAANIAAQAENKGMTLSGNVDDSRFEQAEEKALYTALVSVEDDVQQARAQADYEKVVRLLATLRPYMDAFFDEVTVNAKDATLRDNRLNLLSKARSLFESVIAFSAL